MNWETIKHIYRCVLIHNHKFEYMGGDKYKIITFYLTGEKYWENEFENGQSHGKYISWYRDGSKDSEQKYLNGTWIKTLYRRVI